MKLPKGLLCFVLAPVSAIAQTAVSNHSSEAANLADQVVKLQQSMLQQQKAIAEQQAQLLSQQRELDLLRQQLAQSQAVSAPAEPASPKLIDASLHATEPAVLGSKPASGVPPQTEPKESPLSFHIGGADFTPGGFMDFTTIFRTTNEGTLGTNFFNIPFNNATTGNLTETRLTAQNSRIGLKVRDTFGRNDVAGYVEIDFLGNDAANVEVTSNGHTLRQRLYFLDLKRDKWEVMAGQAWSWLTPNRNGLSPYSSDVFYSLNEDFNYQVGLTWTRAPQFRLVYHPSEDWGLGVAFENPEQFGGQGEITYPAAFSAQVAAEIDSAAGGTSVPNLHPDIISKVGYDTTKNGKHWHAEIAGLLTSTKITDVPVGGTTFVKHTKTGGGVEAAVNLEFVKNVHFVANAFWSDGGGRYIFGMGPDVVVLPNAAGTDLALSLVHSGSGIAGIEAQVTPKTMLYSYYGGAYFRRNFATDTSANAKPGSFVGFGYPGSAGSHNRDIQEPTFGCIETLWKKPQYGALQFISQVSYLTRSPWSVAAPNPKNAHLTMVWVDLRYVLP